MSTTKLPFGSQAFFDLLTEHPEAGRYFALGERVIVVVDGTAYEMVPSGEAPQSAPPPKSQEAPTPQLSTTSPPPDVAGEAYATLSADVVEGVAPLTVNLTGRLVGGPDNNQDYYCVESAFEFGDGMVQSALPSCVAWTADSAIQREFSASYVYDKPGTYQAIFALGDAQSEPLTIVVREAGEPPAPDTPVPSGQDRPVPPDTPEPPAEDGGAEGGNSGGGLCLGPLGLVLLPLLAIVGASRRR
jgi:PKD repeat protein